MVVELLWVDVLDTGIRDHETRSTWHFCEVKGLSLTVTSLQIRFQSLPNPHTLERKNPFLTIALYLPSPPSSSNRLNSLTTLMLTYYIIIYH